MAKKKKPPMSTPAQPVEPTTDPAPFPEADKLMHVRVHETIIPATMMQFMAQSDSPFFGYYKCSFSKMAYNAAIAGKGLAHMGYLLEEDADKGLLTAIVNPEHSIIGHVEEPSQEPPGDSEIL